MAVVTSTITLDAAGQRLLQRHRDWWQRKETLLSYVEGAPLGDLWLPLADGTLASADMDLHPGQLDIERLAGAPQAPGPLGLWGDRFQVADPYGKVPWVEAILGSPIRATIAGGSMRTHSFINSLEEWVQQARQGRRDEPWFGTLNQLTEVLVARSAGRFAVVQPTMRGPSDLAEAVLGPALMSFAMYDSPGLLRRFLEDVTQVFIDILNALLARIPRIEGGYVSPFGIWAPGRVVRTQCDATAFLSARQYREWYLPYDLRICQAVDYSFIHLHSCSLHTVDALLAQKLPHAIQVTLESEPKGPSLDVLIPIFRRILSAKPLLVEGKLSAAQVQRLLDELPTGGLAITARANEW
jgi:hypothetical protein